MTVCLLKRSKWKKVDCCGLSGNEVIGNCHKLQKKYVKIYNENRTCKRITTKTSKVITDIYNVY